MRQLMAIAIVALMVPKSLAQEGPPQIDPGVERQGQRAMASFECAILAAEGSGTIKPSAAKLAAQAHTDYRVVADLFLSNLSHMNNGPLTEYIASVDAEFITGLAFAQASEKIKDLLDETAAFDGSGSYESTRLLRDTQADLEYSRRNCGLLLP